ncbi:MAG: bifunctional UDP-N-acetylmuramoyl-tripeptide:D-alanyl-D-alanine ligase/alanine racemase, partial [Bacteroidaceae bacterium]|nr:bifunctional UDP-N-acetylmuramoyl-tripeptide:D-alanyl-D-alanine ligase/alanine racemase [Bacteroidaceae bacterium]
MYTIDEIAQVIGAQRRGAEAATINWLLIDSRSLCFPEETLFFALKTGKNDGHRYVEELYRRGVRNFVVGDGPLPVSSLGARELEDCNFLVVKSPLQALQD